MPASSYRVPNLHTLVSQPRFVLLFKGKSLVLLQKADIILELNTLTLTS